ncbi:MerR family transcriptional regulator [Glycomyces terrestris]|uniref:MerR family transcriptional regulator n=1 Tax=Glycomyces terrestris TaxID=2493553 RepID=A0A426UWA7_9ACTN|nr:MerR family transcriptional regulator [Glycomyces terrestris]RRR98498.1 MerR family transcriptional regulator [Glycomyces terrestris]
MSQRELLSIGEFSVKTGLSIPALRHYDEVDLLRPARVDPGTGYRRYRLDQAARAVLIRRLRSVDLPIDQIRTMLSDQSGRDAAGVLHAHRERLLERAHAITRLAEALGRDYEEGTEMAVTKEDRVVQVTIPASDLEATVRFYTEAFGLEYDQSIASFQFGAWETDSFFLLTLDAAAGEGGRFGPAMFGLYVDDLDAAHAAALSAGAALVQPPFETDYAPRRSVVADPSGNRISLTQR